MELSKEVERWKFVDRIGTSGALSAFLADYPHSPRASEARLRLLRLQQQHAKFLEAQAQGGAQALEKFLEENPVAADAPRAFEKLREYFWQAQAEKIEQAFQSAKGKRDATLLAAFVEQHPSATQVLQARALLESLIPEASYLEHVRNMRALGQWSNSNRPLDPAPIRYQAIYPIVTKGPTQAVFKDSKQRYWRIPGGEPTLAAQAEEYLLLRGVPPYGALMLLINEKSDASQVETAVKYAVNKVAIACETIDSSICAKSTVVSQSQVRATVVGSHAYRWSSSDRQKTAEIILEIARKNPQWTPTLHANSTAEPTFESSSFASTYRAHLSKLIRDGTAYEVRSAVLNLLHHSGSEQIFRDTVQLSRPELVSALSLTSPWVVRSRARRYLRDLDGVVKEPDAPVRWDDLDRPGQAIKLLNEIHAKESLFESMTNVGLLLELHADIQNNMTDGFVKLGLIQGCAKAGVPLVVDGAYGPRIIVDYVEEKGEEFGLLSNGALVRDGGIFGTFISIRLRMVSEQGRLLLDIDAAGKTSVGVHPTQLVGSAIQDLKSKREVANACSTIAGLMGSR